MSNHMVLTGTVSCSGRQEKTRSGRQSIRVASEENRSGRQKKLGQAVSLIGSGRQEKKLNQAVKRAFYEHSEILYTQG